MTTVATMIGIAFITVLIVAILNLVTFQYGQGAVRAAIDEAARAGSRYGPAGGLAACEHHATTVLGQLLGGTMGDGVAITCADTGTQIVATATVHFDGWIGSIADYDTTLSAAAAKEHK